MSILQQALIVAGIGHFGILIASALTPSVLDWKNELAKLHPFLRTLFWVYGVFIVLMIIGFGTLTLIFAEEMAAGQPVARGLAIFIAVFWGLRLVVQLFVFDATPFLTNGWLKAGYHLLTIAFVYLVVVYATSAFQPTLNNHPL